MVKLAFKETIMMLLENQNKNPSLNCTTNILRKYIYLFIYLLLFFFVVVFEELWITQSSFIFISKYINIYKHLTGNKHNSQIYSILHKYPILTISLYT